MKQHASLSRTSPQNTPARRGFTLVELLVATAIVVLVTGVAYSMYHAVMATLGASYGEQKGFGRATAALDIIRRDLACSTEVVPGSGVALSLSAGELADAGCSTLGLFFAVAKRETDDQANFRIGRVRYWVDSDDDGSSGPRVLFREVKMLEAEGGFGEPMREKLLTDVVAFEVEVFDGTQWLQEWPGQKVVRLPRAGRVRLVFADKGGQRVVETETLVRAGTLF